jgi:hypothetical protein
MTDSPEIRPVVARLVVEPPFADHAARPVRRRYRPLVVGPAVRIRRGGGPWLVRVSTDGRLLPRAWRPAGLRSCLRRLELAGILHRVAAALVAPQDLAGPPPRLVPDDRRPRAEFYGWSLLYQLPGMRGLAAVDPHERFADLPAFFESPHELVDRSEFLASRGIPCRPLALITQPGDFVIAAHGRRCNRFYPGERFRRPSGLGWFG